MYVDIRWETRKPARACEFERAKPSTIRINHCRLYRDFHRLTSINVDEECLHAGVRRRLADRGLTTDGQACVGCKAWQTDRNMGCQETELHPLIVALGCSDASSERII